MPNSHNVFTCRDCGTRLYLDKYPVPRSRGKSFRCRGYHEALIARQVRDSGQPHYEMAAYQVTGPRVPIIRPKPRSPYQFAE